MSHGTRPLAVASALIAALACAACAHQQARPITDASPTPLATAQNKAPMNHFVMIFRQSSRVLTEQEKTQRNDEIKAWAKTVNAQGAHLEPRILTEDLYTWTDNAHGTAGHAGGAGAVTALLFLEAPSFDVAVRVSGGHPGLRYGSTIEVRPWSPPAPAPQAAVR